MADLGTLVTIAEKVFQLLQSPALKELSDWKSALEDLNKTVSSIKNMLMDVHMKPELTRGEQGWVEELKEVLYEADDLFDEVVTLAKMRELHGDAKISEKVLREVRDFFTSKNSIISGYKTSQAVKSIQQKLDVIARDHCRYDIKVDPQTIIRKETVDTSSFLDEVHENIIGRDDDVNAIIDMLLDPNVKENVGFVAIVGVGGLGKTTLAQLVFNHNRVNSKFEKKLWACVSDQDGKKLEVKTIIRNIIESSTKEKTDDVTTMEFMQAKLRKELEEKTFLLILDDVWTEDPNEWNKLKRYLRVGGNGSRVVVTTRSEKTVEVVLGEVFHFNKFMLKGLSDDNSWRLFKLLAFERESDQANDPELARIGKIIVNKCCNVPIAIKVIGTLLKGQTHKWESFVTSRLPEIDTSKESIISILKLSYDYLEPSVKNCFRYCALFPKDYEISKRELTSLWTAQGYIDDGEDTFLILKKRCFFHDVKENEDGMVFFKIHDLIHDLAQEVSRDEFAVNPVISCPTNYLGKTVRHLFLDEGEWRESYFSKLNIRTCYMNIRVDSILVKTIVANWGRLRSLRLYVPDCEKLSESIGKLLHLRYLDLSENKKLKTLPSSITKLYNLQSLLLNGCSCLVLLPDSIGELLHLRYLDLSENENLKTLPSSITKLYNLQSLLLSGCDNLCEWPEGFHKLVNLRLLNIDYCSSLTCMPFGLKHLTALQDLSDFKVSSVTSSGKQSRMQLKDIKYLVNLRGRISIEFGKNVASEEVDGSEEPGYLKHIENLEAVGIYFDDEIPLKQDDEHEILLAKLQPHKTLKHFTLIGYQGAVIPRWEREVDEWATIFPNLVTIELETCERLFILPMLSTLKHLKSLSLAELDNLEFMENSEIRNDSYLGSIVEPFFLSLEKLYLKSLRRLKGWWSGVGENNSTCPTWQLSFPRLSTLIIEACPELTSFPPCPSLKSLELLESNKSLRILGIVPSGNPDFKLEVRSIDSVSYLTTLSAAHLTKISIVGDKEVKSLAEIEEVFKSCSSLRSLTISYCRELASLSGGLEYLTSLEELSLILIPRLDVVGHDINMVLRSLRHNLLYLGLDALDTMEVLPEGMKHLTSLRNLHISDCRKLKSIPEWISCLSSLCSLRIRYCPAIKSLPEEIQKMTSLQRLVINNCPDLKDACQEPSGKDWPKIRHIPRIVIRDY